MFVRTRYRVVMSAVALTMGATAILGPTVLGNLYDSQREKLRDKAREFVDPSVELRAAVESTERQLPKNIAAIQMAIADCNKELRATLQRVRETKEGKALVEKDLQFLAPLVLKGEPCELRGRKLTPAQAQAEASRLIRQRKLYEETTGSREALADKLKRQLAELEQKLCDTQAVAQDFQTKTKTIEAKFALVKANERVQQAKAVVENGDIAAIPSALSQVERGLDLRLLENEERSKLQQGLAAPDPYLKSARDADVTEELKRYTTEQRKEEAENKEDGGK